MRIVSQSDNRIVLESETHKAVVSKMLGNKKPTTGCCRLMKRSLSLPAVVTLKQNLTARGMALLLLKIAILLLTKVLRFQKIAKRERIN